MVWRYKLEICFLPTSEEDETANLGCAVVFLGILENAGLITLSQKKMTVDQVEKTNLFT